MLVMLGAALGLRVLGLLLGAYLGLAIRRKAPDRKTGLRKPLQHLHRTTAAMIGNRKN